MKFVRVKVSYNTNIYFEMFIQNIEKWMLENMKNNP
jgi:hypothetical protein